MSKINIYACGGAGINIAQTYENIDDNIEIIYVDTSHSNFPPGAKNCEIIEDALTGSGKVRSDNATSIIASIPNILIKYKPAKYNIVIFSLGGGSGSVIGPLLLKELNVNGANDDYRSTNFGACVVSAESIKASINSEKTLSTLSNIAAKTGIPIIIYGSMLHSINERNSVDADIRKIITHLRTLFIADGSEIDENDIYNAFRYQRYTDYDPGLNLLAINDYSNLGIRSGSVPISAIEIFCGSPKQRITDKIDYLTTGKFIGDSEDFQTAFPLADNGIISFAIYPIGASEAVNKLNRDVAEHAAKARERQASSRITLGKKDQVDDSGLVL